MRALLLFLDGLGVGSADPEVNPMMRAPLPNLARLCGGELPVLDLPPAGPWVSADATLGVPGRPQSGTGQTALLTGENAAERFGRHFGPWVPTGLRELLARRNLLSRVAGAGGSAAFANAHPPGPPPRRPAAPPLAAEAAGVLIRREKELREGRAVASSFTPGGLTPEKAGAVLSALSAQADLTLFAHYDTDLVGHARDPDAAVAVLHRVDRFLEGLLATLPDDVLLVVASDHGNIEDATAGHTLNPVPVVARGPGAEELLAQVRSIMDVAPGLMALLSS